MMSIWSFQQVLSQRLLAWNIWNFTGGLLMLLSQNAFVQGVGSQFSGWAVINALIAIFGQNGAARRRATLADAETPERRAKEARNLRLILWVNAGLDLLYMLGGWRLLTRAHNRERLRGVGLGILLQGVFLFVFDVIHAQHVPDQRPR
ncbi:MAG: hypothetical protein SF162_09660 [bacterium]|nr:hypothetical protein [bacterium]